MNRWEIVYIDRSIIIESDVVEVTQNAILFTNEDGDIIAVVPMTNIVIVKKV